MLFLAFGISQSFAQPGRSRLSTQDKKAIKWYGRALDEMSAMRRGEAHADTASVMSAVRRAVEADPEFAEPHYLAGAMWSDVLEWELAVDANNAGLSVNPSLHPRAYLENARMLQQLLRPAFMRDAATGYLEFIANNWTRPMSSADSAEVALLISSADFMELALKSPVPYEPLRLGPQVNTPAAEYFPTLFDGGDRLLFTRKSNAESQEDFYVSSRSPDGDWSKARPVLALNTPGNEGAPSVSLDGRVLVFTRCGAAGGAGSCDLYMSACIDDSFSDWQEPVNISALNTSRWESQPSLSWDGTVMVFTREQKPASEEDQRRLYRRTTDLFVSSIDWDANAWRSPRPMSETVNTPGREQSGFFHPDGRHFYFASDGHPGMGGMDLFCCTLEDDGTWGEPVNLGYPINTPGDETGLIVSPDGRTAIFSTDHYFEASTASSIADASDIGGMDLYSFELPPAAQSVETAWFRGAVVSAEDERPLAAHILLTDLETGRVMADLQASASGLFSVPVPTDRPFALLVEHEAHLLYSGHFSSASEDMEGQDVAKRIALQPLTGGAEVVLRNIFFSSGSAVLDEASSTELEGILRFSALNPKANFEVGGHTDDIGSADDNVRLSQLRAEAVVAWLTVHGMAAQRLKAIGYGESRPLSIDDHLTEKGRAANRRTTLSVH